MRRQPTHRPENQLRLALDEVERLKADIRRISDGSGLAITTTTSGSGPTDGPPTTPGAGVEPLPHVLYGSKHSRSLRVTAGTGLNINFEQGQEWVAGVFYSIAADSLAMADDDTNYVFVNTSGAVAANTTGFPSTSTPLAEVVTSSGAIVSVADRRSYLAGGVHGAGILLGNPLEVGIDDTDQGTIILYGDGAGSTEGGEARFYLAADHDATFEYWRIEAFEDDLRFGRSSGENGMVLTAAQQLQLPRTGSSAGIVIGGDTQIYRSAAGEFTIPSGNIGLGVVDTTRGNIRLYGAAAGDNLGGRIILDLAADHDAAFDNWRIEAYTDDLLFRGSTVKARFTYEGELRLPVTGAAAGVLLGGDARIYRYAANVFGVEAGDAITILGGAGDFGAPVNGMLWYNTTTSKLRGYEGGAWGDLIGGTGGTITTITKLQAHCIRP